MIVSNKERNHIVDCSEIYVEGNKILGFVSGIKGALVEIGVYESEEEAIANFGRAIYLLGNGVNILNF